MPVGNETAHSTAGLTVEGGLAVKSYTAASTAYLQTSLGNELYVNGGLVNPLDYYLNGSNQWYESFSRNLPLTDVAIAATQVMTSVPVWLPKGFLVSKLCFVSGATAITTPANWWFALYDTSATPALAGQTADQLTTAWGANTVMDIALATAYTTVASGIHWAAIMVKAGTVNTCWGITHGNAVMSNALVTGQVKLGQTSGSALTTTAPATIATPSGVATRPYVLVH